jgi:hypothetical protein
MLVAAVVLALVVVTTAVWFVASMADHDPAADGVEVDWAWSEELPGCRYDPESQTVEAALTITGESTSPVYVTVIVTAYADENTSQPVGSNRGSVQADGPVDTVLRITIPVDSPPHVGEDDVAACRREIVYAE